MADTFGREKTLLEERAGVFEGLKGYMDRLTAGEKLTVEDRTEIKNRNARIDEIDADIEALRVYGKREAVRDEAAETRGVSRDEADNSEARYEQAFVNWFKRGTRGISEEQRSLLESRDNTTVTLSTSGGEGLSAAADSAPGGYLIPQGFWQNLQVALKAYGGLLDRCNVIQTASGQPMPWPSVDPTGITGKYLTEVSQLGFGGDSAGTNYEFGQGMLNAWTIVSGVVLASLQLLNDSAFDVNQFVVDRMGEAIGRKVAAELQTGSGNSAMLGIQTALAAKADSGIGKGGVFVQQPGKVTLLGQATAAQKHQSSGANNIGFEDAQAMITYVDPAYRAAGRCAWIASDVTLAQLRNVTDAYGHPLWQPSVVPGNPDMVLGYPVVLDQNVGTAASNAVGGLLFGDFHTAMVVRQVNQAGTMRLTERYADFLQVGFLSYIRIDSRSNDLRAAVALKGASSDAS